jgi:hypothetical protein
MMGLAAFNRMRRERAPVERMEAERFVRWRDERNQRLKQGARQETEKEQLEIWREEQAAMQRVGEKVRLGMAMAEEGAPVTDEPLRRDHAAEIAGRNLKDVDQPKDPLTRYDERVPPDTTFNEELVPHMSVEHEGPSAEQVRAAEIETGVAPEPDAPQPTTGGRRAGTMVARDVDLSRRAMETAERGEMHSFDVEPHPPTDADAGYEDTIQDDSASRQPKASAESEDEDESQESDDDSRRHVRIVKDWKSLPAAEKRKIAERLGAEAKNATEASEAIEAELERREAAKQED